MDLVKYPEYKDSGIGWIGEIPEHWATLRIKDYLSFNIGGTPPTKVTEYFEGENIWVSIADINSNEGNVIFDSSVKISDEAIRNSNVKLIPKGSLLYSFKLSVGLTAFAGCDLYTNEAIASFEPNSHVDLCFLKYVFNAGFDNNANVNIYGAKLFNSDLIKFSKFVMPLDLNEQKQIANYLDNKIAKIDKTIENNEKLIELLEEKRVALINQVVTKGLNPNVEMKDSKTDIIGNIPNTWNIIKLRFLCDIKTGNKDTINKVPDGKYPFYVRSPIVERINSYSFDGEAILMAGDGVGAGKVFHYINGKFDYHQRVYNFHNFKNILPKYLFYFLSQKFSDEIEKGSAKSTVDSIRLPMIQNFRVCIPPISEQKEIANYLDKKLTNLDRTKSKIQEQIDLMEEYKESLIYNVVTGKVDVRGEDI